MRAANHEKSGNRESGSAGVPKYKLISPGKKPIAIVGDYDWSIGKHAARAPSRYYSPPVGLGYFEETAALAACANAKFTGEVGVCMTSSIAVRMSPCWSETRFCSSSSMPSCRTTASFASGRRSANLAGHGMDASTAEGSFWHAVCTCLGNVSQRFQRQPRTSIRLPSTG